MSYAGLAPVSLELGWAHAPWRDPASGQSLGARRSGLGDPEPHAGGAREHTERLLLSHYYGRLKERLGWRVARVATARSSSALYLPDAPER